MFTLHVVVMIRCAGDDYLQLPEMILIEVCLIIYCCTRCVVYSLFHQCILHCSVERKAIYFTFVVRKIRKVKENVDPNS